MEIKKWVKRNKVLLSVLILLLVSNLYVAGLFITEQTESPLINDTPNGTQVNIINDSPGSSVNGNVTNNNPTQTQVVIKQRKTSVVTKEIPYEEPYMGTTTKPDHTNT
jgi:flagellar biosynthesis/type III secretory pathway M-ring protein FliF/YscJ